MKSFRKSWFYSSKSFAIALTVFCSFLIENLNKYDKVWIEIKEANPKFHHAHPFYKKNFIVQIDLSKTEVFNNVSQS